MNPWTNEVGPILQTMSMPLVTGREFKERDAAGAPLVAIVNESFANSFFGGDIRSAGAFASARLGSAEVEIVGVVKDALYENMREGTTKENNAAFAYTPYQQSDGLSEMTFYIRASSSAATTLPERIRQTVRSADAGVPVHQMQTLERTVDDALFNERMLALLSAAFGLLATILAAVGLYGVMSYIVSRRTREIGMHGARRRARRRHRDGAQGGRATHARGHRPGDPGGVESQPTRQVSVVRHLASRSPDDLCGRHDPGLVSLFAGYIPARRASRVQPILALRCE